MTEAISCEPDLAAISNTTHSIEIAIDDLRQSSRKSVIIISLMLFISVLSAMFLAYYSFSVTNKLKIARIELDKSKGSLERISNKLVRSENYLRQGLESDSKNLFIAKAIEEINGSRSSIINADNSLKRASNNIPFSQQDFRIDLKIKHWHAVVGSYRVNGTNFKVAESFARKMAGEKDCILIWITPGDRHYAVTLGMPTTETEARLTVARLNEKNVVSDAYAQYEVDGQPWRAVRQFGNCPPT